MSHFVLKKVWMTRETIEQRVAALVRIDQSFIEVILIIMI